MGTERDFYHRRLQALPGGHREVSAEEMRRMALRAAALSKWLEPWYGSVHAPWHRLTGTRDAPVFEVGLWDAEEEVFWTTFSVDLRTLRITHHCRRSPLVRKRLEMVVQAVQHATDHPEAWGEVERAIYEMLDENPHWLDWEPGDLDRRLPDAPSALRWAGYVYLAVSGRMPWERVPARLDEPPASWCWGRRSD